MSVLAKDVFELRRLAEVGGALSAHLLREVAADLIGNGVRDDREGT
ncbi:hypothetical protein [Paraburkholderia sp. ZP32-5]|nr:hypothetical protein [Paraburkholderia sp. ZP32-5]